MNEAVRRFRRRFDGCDSSLLPEVVRAFRELRPKMLLRLSLDIPRYRVGARSPARAQRRDYRIGGWLTTEGAMGAFRARSEKTSERTTQDSQRRV
jgi:hypothetical protein